VVLELAMTAAQCLVSAHTFYLQAQLLLGRDVHRIPLVQCSDDTSHDRYGHRFTAASRVKVRAFVNTNAARPQQASCAFAFVALKQQIQGICSWITCTKLLGLSILQDGV
jgi:hypothetical protein